MSSTNQPETTGSSTSTMMPAGSGASDPGAFPDPIGPASGGGRFSAAGYIDSALPVTQFRLRYDDAYRSNRPDRADFFYPSSSTYSVKGSGPGVVSADKSMNTGGATRVDLQELSGYLEVAVSDRLSGFCEIPFRYVDITFQASDMLGNQHHFGLGDVNFGFKYAFLYTPESVLTFQFRTFAPSGDAARGLGTNNWNLEPALLYYQRLSDRLYLEAELRDFIPVGASDATAGNVIRYGAGLSYLVYSTERFRIAPVGELVGWTVLSGKVFNPDAGPDGSGASVDATGQTIVNAKVGLRIGFGEITEQGGLSPADFYIGYGRSLTGDVWYKDILRAEFRIRF